MSQTREANTTRDPPKVVGQVGSRDLHRLYPKLLVMYDLAEAITLSVQDPDIKNRAVQVEIMAPYVAALTAATDSMAGAFSETLQKGGVVTEEAASTISDGLIAILSAQIEFCNRAEESLLDIVHKAPEPLYKVTCAEDVIALLEFGSSRIEKVGKHIGLAVYARMIMNDPEFVRKFIEDSIAEDPKITWEEGYAFLQKEAQEIREGLDLEFSCPPRLASVAPFETAISSH
jgi:hypothetical protein